MCKICNFIKEKNPRISGISCCCMDKILGLRISGSSALFYPWFKKFRDWNFQKIPGFWHLLFMVLRSTQFGAKVQLRYKIIQPQKLKNFIFNKMNGHIFLTKNQKPGIFKAFGQNPRISSVLGTNKKPCISKVCTPRGCVSRGLAVFLTLSYDTNLQFMDHLSTSSCRRSF